MGNVIDSIQEDLGFKNRDLSDRTNLTNQIKEKLKNNQESLKRWENGIYIV